MNLSILGWYDPFELLCSLRPRMPLFRGEGGVRLLTLRGPRNNADDPDDALSYVTAKEGVKWTEAKALLERLKRDAEGRTGNQTEFGRVFFELLEPGQGRLRPGVVTAYTAEFSRLVYVCRSNPATTLLSGADAVQTSVPGQVILQNTRVVHGAVNAGDTPRINVIVDIRGKPKVTEAPQENDIPAA